MKNSQFIPSPVSTEGIDFNKLGLILRINWYWIALIFLVSNFSAYLAIRYTKQLYESSSEIKLDIKDDATDFGIKTLGESQNLNIISGEIELIKSKLFLSKVLDSIPLDVSYYSKGEILNFELFNKSPISVQYDLLNPEYFNKPFFFDVLDDNRYEIQIGEGGQKIRGVFNRPLSLDGGTLTISKNTRTPFEEDLSYFFVINSRSVLLDFLSKNLIVEPQNFNANTIRISFKDNNPTKAHDLVNKIDSLYLLYSNEQKNLANKQKIDWITDELHQIENKMEGLEDYFETFTLQNKSTDLDEDLKRTVGVIANIDSQRFELSARINNINTLYDQLMKGDFFITISQRQWLPNILSRNLEDLQQKQIDINKLGLSYKEQSYAFREKQNEVDLLKKNCIASLSDLKNYYIQSLQKLNTQKSRLETEFVNMPDKNTQYNKNQRYYKLYEEFYLTLMQSKSEFEITQAGTTPEFKILSPATYPTEPISPKKFMIAGIGLVASGVLIFFFVGVLYLINNKITSLSEVEKINEVPVLGIIPSFRSNGSGMYVVDHARSMVSEAFRTLRTNLDFFSPHLSSKIISITSTVSGEGKSFIAKNLGGVIALSKKKVILIDLDMRKPKHNIPQFDPSKGISTILIRKHELNDCLVASGIENLDYLSSGPHPPNPSELLLNGEFSALLEQLKSQYDFIILDTPPVGIVTDGIMAMKRSDVNIYVFRANYSKKEFMHNLKRIININQFSNITTILNALPPTGNQAYGYGYYEEPAGGNFLRKLFNRK